MVPHLVKGKSFPVNFTQLFIEFIALTDKYLFNWPDIHNYMMLQDRTGLG